MCCGSSYGQSETKANPYVLYEVTLIRVMRQGGRSTNDQVRQLSHACLGRRVHHPSVSDRRGLSADLGAPVSQGNSLGRSVVISAVVLDEVPWVMALVAIGRPWKKWAG